MTLDTLKKLQALAPASLNLELNSVVEWSKQESDKRSRLSVIIDQQLNNWKQMKQNYHELKKSNIEPNKITQKLKQYFVKF